MPHATGTFEVRLQPQASREHSGNTLSRMTLDKTFSGDLQGESSGEMLAARTPVEGSAAYVAIERVTATLAGRSGGFTLVHRGWMEQGGQRLLIDVVPDSGTEALAGIAGTLGLRLEDGVHHYDFDYTLPAG